MEIAGPPRRLLFNCGSDLSCAEVQRLSRCGGSVSRTETFPGGMFDVRLAGCALVGTTTGLRLENPSIDVNLKLRKSKRSRIDSNAPRQSGSTLPATHRTRECHTAATPQIIAGSRSNRGSATATQRVANQKLRERAAKCCGKAAR